MAGGPICRCGDGGVVGSSHTPSLKPCPPFKRHDGCCCSHCVCAHALSASGVRTAHTLHTGSLTHTDDRRGHCVNDLCLTDAPDVAYKLQVLRQFKLQLLGGQ